MTNDEIKRNLSNREYCESISRSELKKQFRQIDESHLWPICGRFNATERAIRRVDRLQRDSGTLGNFEYSECLENEISRIVNGW